MLVTLLLILVILLEIRNMASPSYHTSAIANAAGGAGAVNAGHELTSKERSPSDDPRAQEVILHCPSHPHRRAFHNILHPMCFRMWWARSSLHQQTALDPDGEPEPFFGPACLRLTQY